MEFIKILDLYVFESNPGFRVRRFYMKANQWMLVECNDVSEENPQL